MRRNGIGVALAALLALGLMAGVASAAAPRAARAASAAAKPARSAKAKRALHQFTGVVTAMDKQSITVEKAGKQPQTRTFVRDEKTLTSGDVEKEAHVTVYFREENGKAVAHRVVVKSGGETAAR